MGQINLPKLSAPTSRSAPTLIEFFKDSLVGFLWINGVVLAKFAKELGHIGLPSFRAKGE